MAHVHLPQSRPAARPANASGRSLASLAAHAVFLAAIAFAAAIVLGLIP